MTIDWQMSNLNLAFESHCCQQCLSWQPLHYHVSLSTGCTPSLYVDGRIQSYELLGQVVLINSDSGCGDSSLYWHAHSLKLVGLVSGLAATWHLVSLLSELGELLQWLSHDDSIINIISRITVQSIECKWVLEHPICLSVCRSGCQSGGWIMEKRLIGSGCCLGWWVGSVDEWVY